MTAEAHKPLPFGAGVGAGPLPERAATRAHPAPISSETPPHPLADALLAARLCAIDPALGGMILRGSDDRDDIVATLRAALPADAPCRRLPVHADEAALFGGLDLAATLGSGRATARRGLLADAAGGLVVIPMAERMTEPLAARIAAALDAGGPTLVALDDGHEADERPPAALAERLAFRIDLAAAAGHRTQPETTRTADMPPARPDTHPLPPQPFPNEGRETASPWRTRPRHPADERPPSAPAEGQTPQPDTTCPPAQAGAQSRNADDERDARLHGLPDRTPAPAGERHDPDTATPPPHPLATDDHLRALAAAALALGIDSARAPLFALRAARAAARLAGRDALADEDIALAARLVLGPRATRLPAPPEAEAEAGPPPPPPPDRDGADEAERGEPGALDDIVLAAAMASLPADLLARIAAGGARGRGSSRARGAGERRRSPSHGRPLGARAGTPGGGARLSLIDTLRAAAPWQRLRAAIPGRVAIRRDDLRVRRFETRAEAVTIFAVDASGSAALARLAEAKGAVELLLAQAYVKRAQVALLAFRGLAAELLLPPTRSLTRARRSLADLPGGGGTPLAAGLAAALALAQGARRHGRTPFLVVLTDGRANIAADGTADRAAAQADAAAAATAIGAAGIAAAFVDTAARPRPEGAALAAAMGARYLPLPRADAATMHAAVLGAQP